ncbi:hypothetical protein DL98DRAFT_579188 [Cadophora sp. DSE1049]|nr:hypothetical protein DL98DRAFT_579188 [Cadophora sp. DSE1049]
MPSRGRPRKSENELSVEGERKRWRRDNITSDHTTTTTLDAPLDAPPDGTQIEEQQRQAAERRKPALRQRQRASRRKRKVQQTREEGRKQQIRLYAHPRRFHLQTLWDRAAKSKKSRSHFAVIRRIGNHILGASAASCELPERDYILTDLEGLDDYLERGWVADPEIHRAA